MSLVVCDVEADGPIPHKYSMISFGAVIVDDNLDKTFYGETKPISDIWLPDALIVSGFSREEHLKFDEPIVTMNLFKQWLKENSDGKPVFISDNLAFDWQWINFYFHYYLNENPFGHSGRRIGDLYCGMKNDMRKNAEWKKLYRKTSHDHSPVNDARGNAEAILAFKKLGLK
jgi:hypothetical protein